MQVSEKERRIDVGEVSLTWGNPSQWKRTLRAESDRRHLAQPIAERLRAALALVIRRPSTGAPHENELESR